MKFDGINSVIEHKSFKRDLKKLRKRFRTLRLYLIEIYYKGDKDTEDIKRIKSFISEEFNGS